MTVHTYPFQIATKGFGDTHDLTHRARQHLAESGIREGTLTVFTPGSTAGVTTIEYESGCLADLAATFERIAPQDMHYDHNARWGDGNGFSHVRAAMLGPSLSVPCVDGELLLGTWQQIVLVDFDNGGRDRRVIVQVVGE